MHIVFATLYDPRDARRGSGTYFFLSRELERQGHRVERLGPVDYSHPPFISRVLYRLARLVGKRHRFFQDIFVARRIGAWVDARLSHSQADVLLTNDYAIAGFCRRLPVALYTDHVFPKRYRDVRHPWQRDLSAFSVLSCQRLTRRGLERTVLCCFPSDWAVRSALEYGVAERAKIERIEFGCNLFEPPPAEVARGRSFAAIAKRGRLRVLLVGNRDWQLKGGDTAVAVVRELRRRGRDASLDLVGARPPRPLAEDWVRVHGEIDKIDDHRRLSALYSADDLLLVPTRAEGFGIVFVEAAAHGLPSLSYDSGTGVNNSIRHRESGLLLPFDASPAAFADRICRWFDHPSEYDDLVRGARSFYQTVANWPHAVGRLTPAIERRLSDREARSPA